MVKRANDKKPRVAQAVPNMPDPRAWERARVIGAVDEARLLGSALVGTEHLLVAALADPAVQWAFRTVGVDLRGLRAEVANVTGRRKPCAPSGGITLDAAEAVMHASAHCGRLDDDSDDSEDPDGPGVARTRRELARRFLARTRDSEARAILDRLGVIRFRTRVLATIEHHEERARLTQT